MLDEQDKQWIKAAMAEQVEKVQAEMAEQLEKVETRLLRAFRSYSHPMEARLRVQKASTRAFNERLDALEDRVEFLEEGRTDGGEG